MWPSYSVQIPPGSLPSVKRYLDADVVSLEMLCEALQDEQATADVEELAERCAAKIGIPPSVIEAVLSVAINVSRIRRTLDVAPSAAVAIIRNSLPTTSGERMSPDLEQAWGDRARYLEEMIAKDSPVDVMSKVRDLLFDHQAVLVDTSVATDVRHVYNASAERILGGMVLHNVGLRFLESGDTSEMHCTLSSDAVRDLLSKLERALLKEATAVAFLEEAGVPELTPKRGRE